ncbi:Hypothetical protein PHPALM_13451 [Phytophthora palmivora]|uniref:Uncharacterized protein n=1 Tax=Phytophthora palmivora TaxID=4796 RepID=A0A2P4XX79_9STRA|nr:Hypothetical protein PHPALM_13451 [Phytophthora palmivora]
MQIIKPNIINDLNGPVHKPTARSSKLEAAKALLHLIKESEITTGSFDANDLFDTRLSAINTALMSIFDLLKPLWIPPRMTLGPSGAAMLWQRGDQEAKRMMDVITPTMAQGSNAKLESYFQAAMSRFLKEQQGPSNPVILASAEDRDVDMIDTQVLMNTTQMISILILPDVRL